ncbi:hypothetical protein BH688_12180 [Kushneria phosphatilytica]|uniref:ABC transporter substrate-binding protein n=2 Tax=Kushneria phosphatilytica TaxID=657387 RepID=A0A1S1NTG9_9GAMM|nr:hypothetical protein BH688_12180 [Kushneria phosphatilytica]QEL12490.1 ABC transporter substrate-binding protein [Kushneria phosphatilytica]
MRRRDFLVGAAGTIGASWLMGSIGSLAWAETDASCFRPWDDQTRMISWPKKNPPYNIALSNSYIGNEWRSEMVKIARLYSERDAVKPLIKKLTISSAGNDVNAQIAQINQMILSGVDAIVLNAASPTGLNSTIDRAVNAGILVVSFDNVVTTPKAVTVNQDQFEMGRRWAEFIVKQIGDSGNVLMVRGVAGTFVDNERYKGGRSVFDKHPQIRTTDVYGNWDNGTAQKVTADALASSSGFDAVWSEGGESGIVRAFKQAGAKVPPIGGEGVNGFRQQAAQDGFPILSIGQSAALSAMSIKVALQMLQGEQMPQAISVPFNEVASANLKEGVNYFSNVPDSFYAAISIPACDLNFDAQAILNQQI